MSRIVIDLKKKELVFLPLAKKYSIQVGTRVRKAYMCDQCKALITDKLGHAQWHKELIEFVAAVANKTIDISEVSTIELNIRDVNS